MCARLRFVQGGAAKLTLMCVTPHTCLHGLNTNPLCCAVSCCEQQKYPSAHVFCVVPHASGCGCCKHGSLKCILLTTNTRSSVLHKASQHTLTGLLLLPLLPPLLPPLLLLLRLVLLRLLLLLLRPCLLLLPCALPCPRVTRPS